MPIWKIGQPVTGNVYSGAKQRSSTGRFRTTASSFCSTGGGCTGTSNRNGGLGSHGYSIDRYNPAYDRLEEGSVVEDWIPRDLPGINKMLRIIYARDAIAGPAVDIMANLPWSPFEIQGVKDKKIEQFYQEACSLYGAKAEDMPAITTEYLVLGRFCGSLIFDEAKGYWTSYVPHDSDFLRITPIPIQGFDPKIDLMLSPGYRQFLSSIDYRDKAALETLPQRFIDELQSGSIIPLDPLSTLYLRRKSSPYDFIGTSLYTRIIPFWALEKALMNASMTAARRRAGNILHVVAGLDDKWEPGTDEMEDLAGLFIQADEDPVGAVVVTRTGVDASEIREGGQLWKWTDEWQTWAEAKMRGLGISEALLSGEATYNNMEQAKSTFTEQILVLRQLMTKQAYLNKMETLARAHGFVKRSQAELSHAVRVKYPMSDSGYYRKRLTQKQAFSIPKDDLILPNIHWAKSLLPEGDQDYLDMLEKLKEEGVPIPLRIWAARAGYNLDEALEMLSEDTKLRKTIKKWENETGAGPDEDSAFGDADQMPAEPTPFWDRSDQFVGLRRGEAAACMKELVKLSTGRNGKEALANHRKITSVFASILKDDGKVEVMNYMMMRLGLAQDLPVSDSTYWKIAEHIEAMDHISNRRKMQEIFYLTRMGAQHKVTSHDVEEAVGRGLSYIEQNLQDENLKSDLKGIITSAQRSPAMSPSSPTLFSGSLQ